MSVSFQVAVAKSYENGKEKEEDTKPSYKVNREAMTESKILRSHLGFIQRMENDSYNRRVNNQLAGLREANEDMKARVDKIALNKVATKSTDQAKKASTRGGVAPTIVSHHRSKQFEGFGKKVEWGPLDGY